MEFTCPRANDSLNFIFYSLSEFVINTILVIGLISPVSPEIITRLSFQTPAPTKQDCGFDLALNSHIFLTAIHADIWLWFLFLLKEVTYFASLLPMSWVLTIVALQVLIQVQGRRYLQAAWVRYDVGSIILLHTIYLDQQSSNNKLNHNEAKHLFCHP